MNRPSHATRALALTVKHAELAAHITDLSNEIRDAECPQEVMSGQSHLREAFHVEKAVEGGYDVDRLSEDGIREYISGCPVCVRLFDAIRERKKVRRQLSHLRSRITVLGKAELKARGES